MERAEPGAFSFDLNREIILLLFSSFFLDEYVPVNKTVVSGFYGCGFTFVVRAEHFFWHCMSVYSGWWGFNADLRSGPWYCLCPPYVQV